MANSRLAFMGAGLATGLEKATDTLLQLSIAKQKLKNETELKNAETKYKEQLLKNQEMMYSEIKDNLTKGMVDTSKAGALTALADSANPDTAAAGPSGALIGSMSAGGNMAPAAPQPNMADRIGMSGGEFNLKAQSASKGMGSAMMTQAEKNAPAIAQAVKNGDYAGYSGADRYTKAAVARILGDQGVSITQQELEFKAKQSSATNVKTQDAKVNQAIHLRALADQYYDSKTGAYNVPQAQYSEMVMGLASLVANSNQTTDSARREIKQRTAQGDINSLASYLTGSPKNASSQDMMKNLIDSIDRQGKVAEQERDTYIKKGYGNSFNEYLEKSPSQKNGGKPENPDYAKFLQLIGQ